VPDIVQLSQKWGGVLIWIVVSICFVPFRVVAEGCEHPPFIVPVISQRAGGATDNLLKSDEVLVLEDVLVRKVAYQAENKIRSVEFLHGVVHSLPRQTSEFGKDVVIAACAENTNRLARVFWWSSGCWDGVWRETDLISSLQSVRRGLPAVVQLQGRFQDTVVIEKRLRVTHGQISSQLPFCSVFLQTKRFIGPFNSILGRLRGFSSFSGLFGNRQKGQNDRPCCRPVWPSKEAVPTWGVPFGIFYVFLGMLFVRFSGDCAITKLGGFLCAFLGGAFILTGYEECKPAKYDNSQDILWHSGEIVTQKHLTSENYRNTLILMANVLNTDKQIAVISALAEGSSIRSIERITGVHRDTVMRLGVKIGQGCTALMDAKMRDLSCTRLEMDEIWGFVGKKDRNVRIGDSSQVGSVWTFCAIDAETKLVPAFKVGGRDTATANAFVQDVASRMRNRVQISTDGLRAYVEAVEKSFGADVDFAQIVKTYGREEVSDNRRYSAPEFVSSEKKVITGNPDQRLISTSYIERLNATTRLHMRRLTRLTLAFSKKRENFEAAVGLHFAYYNFVKRHNTLRCTPAMAAGVERDFWTVGNLVEAAS
jgi:IS1 family transposase